MKFDPTPLPGAFLVRLEERIDERGFFARSWCRREFEEHGLDPRLAQCSISYNKRRGTLRGIHYQIAPHEEAKLVRCTRGSVYDVIIDLRPDSPAYMQHFGIVLDADERTSLYSPEGFAHGFLTLVDGSEIFYQMSAFYEPAAARGIRWNDPAFGIRWPGDVLVISEKDRTIPDFVPER